MAYQTDQDMYNGKVTYGFITVKGNSSLSDSPEVYFKCRKTTVEYTGTEFLGHNYTHYVYTIWDDLGGETSYFKGAVDAVVSSKQENGAYLKTYRVKLTHDFGLKAPKETHKEDGILGEEDVAVGDAYVVSAIYLKFGDVKTNAIYLYNTFDNPTGEIKVSGSPYGYSDKTKNNMWAFFVDREKCSSGYIES